ncbi:hypothetical protein OESDEN_18321 [Oesophagostomum dentatum]|uniref:Uncharacterized protein n=1 Tax=Oesophagostomum dentatum TaxID=61180 RepID=A0A0B1S9K9_OESDE|nr:hypothetical protein OESDEN_18321 [Oesophagostomum dentatum]
MNELIVNNWHSLPPRKIGCVDYIPGCDEVWGLYFDYIRKLDTFTNAVISRLVLYYGMITPSLLQTLAQALSRARITMKALIIHNCHCDCGVEEFITFMKSVHLEVLAIDVFDMMDFGRSLLSDEAVAKLKSVLIFSNGDDIMSGIVVDPFYYEAPIDLHGVCRLLTVCYSWLFL